MELNSKPKMKSEKESVRMFFLQKVFWDKRWVIMIHRVITADRAEKFGSNSIML